MNDRLQQFSRRFTEPEANPEIGSRTFFALLCVACVAAFLIVAFGLWVRG